MIGRTNLRTDILDSNPCLLLSDLIIRVGQCVANNIRSLRLVRFEEESPTLQRMMDRWMDGRSFHDSGLESGKSGCLSYYQFIEIVGIVITFINVTIYG